MLSLIIRIIHFILVVLIVISPFISNFYLKKNILVFLVYLLFQYLTGYQKCGLTELEYLAMGQKYQEGFLYRLINPWIKIPESYFDKWLFVIHIILIMVLIYQIYSHYSNKGPILNQISNEISYQMARINPIIVEKK
jgi:hypothetical protein